VKGSREENIWPENNFKRTVESQQFSQTCGEDVEHSRIEVIHHGRRDRHTLVEEDEGLLGTRGKMDVKEENNWKYNKNWNKTDKSEQEFVQYMAAGTIKVVSTAEWRVL
jgi:hypothetical protein